MTRRSRQIYLVFVAATSAALLALTLTNRHLLADTEPPQQDLRAMGAWLASHPADWLTASIMSDAALDSDSRRRSEIWIGAHDHAKRLAPNRPNTDAAFVRAGLFHWYELGRQDRQRVLAAAAPLLRDPQFFARMHRALWQLTRDFDWLHQHAPRTFQARAHLRDLALAAGRFDHYRLLRSEVRELRRIAFFSERRKSAPIPVLLNLLPEKLDRLDEPLVRAVIEDLDRLAFDPEQIPPRVDEVAVYAVRHDLRPLEGFVPLLDASGRMRDSTRARLALKLNRPGVATTLEVTSASDPRAWRPYYVERALFEARQRRDAAAAASYLARAGMDGPTVRQLAAAAEVARVFGRAADEQRYRAQLAAMPPKWSGTCGADEICVSATADVYTSGAPLRLTLTTVQSDETPPYVEIRIDDLPRAEGEVRDLRTFEIGLPAGVHEVEVRVANPHTRNGVQRRLRVS